MEPRMQKNIAANLKYLRNYYGYTQRQLAELLHISRSAYATIETGHRIPRPDLLIRLSQLFHVRVDIFFESEPEVFIREVTLTGKRSEEVSALISLYHNLSPFSQGRLHERASALLKKEKEEKKDSCE